MRYRIQTMKYSIKTWCKKILKTKLHRYLFLMFIFVCFVFLIFAVRFFTIQHIQNKECKKFLERATSRTENLQSEIDTALDIYENSEYLSDSLCARLNSMLSTYYNLQTNYEKSVEYSIQAIYYAQRCHDSNFAAWCYIDLANIYLQLGAYDQAEGTVFQALELYGRQKGKKDIAVEQFAYMNLAEIYSMKKDNLLAREYLQLFEESIKGEARDSELLHYTGQAISARILLNEGKYEDCSKALADLETHLEDYPLEDEFWKNNVVLCYWDVYAMLSFDTGNIEEGLRASEKLLSYCEIYNEEYVKAHFIDSLVRIANLEVQYRDDKYHELFLRQFPEILEKRNQLTGEFISYAHSSLLEHYREEDRRSKLFLMIIGGVLMISVMIHYMLRLRRLNHTDGLTGAYNRRYFDYILDQSQNRHETFGIAMFDFDFFKSINDEHGHLFGDEVLIRGIEVVKECLGIRDRVFRYGGEEFCIISKKTDLGYLIDLADEIRRKIEEQQWEPDLTVTISIGIGHTSQTEEIMSMVDENLYKAKSRGRNQICYK